MQLPERFDYSAPFGFAAAAAELKQPQPQPQRNMQRLREEYRDKRIKVKGFYGDDLTAMVQSANEGLENFVADAILRAEASGLAEREAANPLRLSKADRELRKELNRAMPRRDIIQIDGYLPGAVSFDYIMSGEILCMEILPVGAFLRVIAEIKDREGKKAVQYTIKRTQDGAITGDASFGAIGRTGVSNYENLFTTVSNDGRIEWQGPSAGASGIAKLVDPNDAKRLQGVLNLAGNSRDAKDDMRRMFQNL